MTKEEIISNNILIAKFMGWKIDNSFPDKGRVWRSPDGRTELDSTLKFHLDWNWLMSVIEHIEKGGEYKFGISLDSVKVSSVLEYDTTHFHYFKVEKENTKIETTYKGVVEFIVWSLMWVRDGNTYSTQQTENQ